MKKAIIFLMVLMAIIFTACKKDGNQLTEDFCVKKVQNSWDCVAGAKYTNGGSMTVYSCYAGDRILLIDVIHQAFAAGIDTNKSYYKNRVLYLEWGESQRNTLTVQIKNYFGEYESV